VGALLTAALVAIPPAAARNAAGNLKQYATGATVLGAAAAAFGICLGKITALPAGPLIVLASTAAFLVSTLFSRSVR
jgi:ABC-type Mn2+/Zn2+ transport system permease subunit